MNRSNNRCERGNLPWSTAMAVQCGFAILVMVTTPTEPSRAGAATYRSEANGMVEIAMEARLDHADPFNAITVDVDFTDPSGRLLRVPAYWAGGRQWRVRYASPVLGVHRFRSQCSDARDGGLQGIEGSVEIVAYAGDNALMRHGPLRVAEGHRYLEHVDGTPFFWLGDTWWMGLCHRLHWPDEFQRLAADRKAKGFNVIQIVAGLYPDMGAFDPRGANEAGFPWEKDYARIRPEYFDAADKRLKYLVDEGFTPCIVGAWGYYQPWMGVERLKQHWRYVIARYGAMPVVWCVAGEANLPWYLAKGFPYDDRQQVHAWTEVARYVRETDPFDRPVTIHPTAIGRYTSRHAIDEPRLLDFDMLQTPHGQREAVPVTIKAMRESYAASPTLPVINGEASYEMLSDSLPTRWTRTMFWLCMTNGAAGHTYGANGIWQCNRKDQAHGNSPHGGNYGKISWDEAMRLPGSQQLALGKRLFEQYAWQQFRPHPEWAVLATDAELSLDGSHWIWYPEGKAAQDAPAEKRYFRRVFVVPEGKVIAAARLRVSADDSFSASLNAQPLGGGGDWHRGMQFDQIAGTVKPGANVLSIVGENLPTSLPANPAGLIYRLEIRFSDGQTMAIASDAATRCSKAAVAGWEKSGFDDSSWASAQVAGRHGDPPWGAIVRPSDEYFGPQATGIPGKVRIIYMPEARAIVVRQLGSQGRWKAGYFDTLSGKRTEIGAIVADAEGNWQCAAPKGCDQDWVLVLEASGEARAEFKGEGPEGKHPGVVAQGPGAAAGNSSPGNDVPTSGAAETSSRRLLLANERLAWHLDWSDGALRTTRIENRLSGHGFATSRATEVALVFSSAVDRVQAPLVRVDDFAVRAVRRPTPDEAIFELRSPTLGVEVAAHYKLEGATRRKWLEVSNRTDRELLLLDVELDDLSTEASCTGGGQGQPVFLEEELFAAVEHPAGINQAERGRLRLMHHPGRRLKIGATMQTHVALVSAARPGGALEHFVNYVQSKCRRKPRALGVYTPFGINNQWGACPTLDDEQVLDVLGLLEKLQTKGVRFDYFTLDTGWVDPGSDLTRFRPVAFPEGPGKVVDRIRSLSMQFGLWFATGWTAESCWDYPPALAGQPPVDMTYRLGYPDKARGSAAFCFGAEAYCSTLRRAVLHHVREHGVRFVKFDGGSYWCDRADHGHLPGKYSMEHMYEQLIALANDVRAAAPDVFVMWYWGLRSPFWALHGDSIFESGLHMEGSGTSAYPTLYYRDSVTLAQDQNAQYAQTIPPLAKDSLGVWLSDTRWGNFMAAQRWREAVVMDLGRGNLLFPNLWGNLYYLTDDDAEFLARMSRLAKENESLLLHRRNIAGDPMRNEVYGYAYGEDARGLVFLSNAHFGARPVQLRLDESLGLTARPGTRLEVTSHFPDRTRVMRADGAVHVLGDTLQLWLRPFETLLLEVGASGAHAGPLPERVVTREHATKLGVALPLATSGAEASRAVRFTEAARFESMKMAKRDYWYATRVAELPAETPILAVVVRLRRGEAEWRWSPVVAEIVQACARVGDQNLQLVPVPDARQYGNTQKAGCSWIVYKTRLSRDTAGKPLRISVHAHLPEGVEAQTEAWIVGRWWQESARPSGDGYYADAPS